MANLVKVDRNGSKHYEGFQPCDRCGGDGVYKWGAVISWGNEPPRTQYAGTCFKCGGSGKVWTTWIERTPEYEAKLAAQRAKRAAERQAKAEEARKAYEAAKAEREAAEAARKAISQHVGAVGDKVALTVTLDHKASFEVRAYAGFGTDTMHVYTFRDEAGNALIWKTTSSLGRWGKDDKGWETFTPVEEGDKVSIKATIKAHGEYKGEKQTELQRVRLV